MDYILRRYFNPKLIHLVKKNAPPGLLRKYNSLNRKVGEVARTVSLRDT